MSEQDSTAPPASQEQLITHPSDCRCQWCRGKAVSQEQAQQPSIAGFKVVLDPTMPPGQIKFVQQPSEFERAFPTSRRMAAVQKLIDLGWSWDGSAWQQPSGGEVKAAPVESYPAQDQAFHAFWYSHMLDDLMQPPLAGISHSTARYIWDSALAPKPEPMPEAVRVWANSPELVEDGNQWQQGYEHARAWVHAQLSVTKEQA